MDCRMSGHINLIVHHKGRLERDDHGTLEYVDNEFYVWENCEVDLMTLWIVLDLCKSRGGYQRCVVVFFWILTLTGMVSCFNWRITEISCTCVT